ncbi:MAG: branched-chain amino acid ABC transporter permease [Haloechinothrix sp.]
MDWEFILSSALRAGVGVEAVVFCLAAVGLNVHFGYTGLLNFGQVAFLAIAAYGLAMTVSTFGLSFWLGILVGLLGAVVLALLLGVPTLRLRADYLAIVTIAAAEIIRLLFRSVTLHEYTGGSDGLQAFADEFYAMNPYSEGRLGFGPLTFDYRVFWVLTVGWGLVALSTLLVWLLMRSPWGRVVKGIREDEHAVRSLGKSVFSYKMQALVLGGVIGSLGGFIFALGSAAVQPDAYGSQLTFFAYVIVILGGAARVLGPIVGAVIFWFLLIFIEAVLRSAVSVGYIPTDIMDTTQASQVRFILVGLGLALLVIYRPQGIFGDKREIALHAR